jgi:hypothetical protein
MEACASNKAIRATVNSPGCLYGNTPSRTLPYPRPSPRICAVVQPARSDLPVSLSVVQMLAEIQAEVPRARLAAVAQLALQEQEPEQEPGQGSNSEPGQEVGQEVKGPEQELS